MQYNDFLPNLACLLGPGPFDTNSVSSEFKRCGPNRLPIKLTKAYPLKHFETKRISADLDKLYRMTLLKRKSIARRYQNSRNGAIFGRGRKYIYNFTKQGWKYPFI